MSLALDGPLLKERYRLGPKLGKGSQGELFLARDEWLKGDEKERLVVVKRLRLHGTWKALELFEREVKVLSQLRHAGVPRHLASFEEPPGTFNLVMERAPGDNLRELTERRRLSQNEVRDILIRALEILDYLHTRSPVVVHRDIKPSNILRAPDGRLSLVDFGGVLDAARERGGSTVVGTFGYMAPEQLHGEATPATDIYALGATIVALLGGIEPEDVPRKGLRMDLERHLSSIDPALLYTLIAMTDPDPEKRPQRARDVISLLAKGPPKPPRTGTMADDVVALTIPKAAPVTRQLFSDIGEPLGTLLRFGVLGIGAGGWIGMASIRFALGLTISLIALLAFPAFKKVVGVGRELDAMLVEGQSGFTDMIRGAMARKARHQ